MILSEVALSLSGRPIVVMGGAPSLISDLEKIKSNAFWLSANHHGHLVRPADYLVCSDLTHQVTGKSMADEMAEYGVPTISPHLWSDIRVNDHPQDFPMNSGILALWVAAALGGYPVIAAGFEFFRGKTYHHDPDAKTTGRIDMDRYDAMVRHLIKAAPGAHFRAISGPLTRHFKRLGTPLPARYQPPRWARNLADMDPVDVEWTGTAGALYRQRPRAGDRIRLSSEEAINHRRRFRLLSLKPEQC